jgi:hypothetical protein
MSADTASDAVMKHTRTSNHRYDRRRWRVRQREGRPFGIGIVVCIATMAVFVNFRVPWWLFLVEIVVALLAGVGVIGLTGFVQHRHRRK